MLVKPYNTVQGQWTIYNAAFIQISGFAKFVGLVGLLLLSTQVLKAQNFSAVWNGNLKNGPAGSLHVAFNIKQVDHSYVTTFDVLEQKAVGIPCNTVINGDSITIKITGIGAGYKGKLVGNTIEGTYIQNNLKIPLTLQKQLRPQTPVAPFTYISEDVTYDNADKSMHFGATFTRPKATGKYPCVIIISGSGTQDRDGTLFGHKLYAVLADYLTKNGIAILRVDDRGAGQTSEGAPGATSASYATDVEAGLNYLKTRADVNVLQLGLIGHSEGGTIAPMVAARRKDVSFIVLWGAPVVGGTVINVEQNADQLSQALSLDKLPGGADDVAAFKNLHTQILQQFATVNSVEELNAKLLTIFEKWKAGQTTQTLQRLMVTNNSIVGQNITAMYDGIYNNPWFKFFITYNPLTDLQRVTCPVLAVYGGKDTQVKPQPNVQLINQILTRGGNKNFKTIVLPGLNHLLQTAQTGQLAEYVEIEETMAPVAMQQITNWIKAQVK